MSLPLVRPQEICEQIHGESGLDGFTFPKYDYDFDKRNAVNFIVDTLLENDEVTMVTTGPMSNLAMAIRLEPKIVSHIKEIVLNWRMVQLNKIKK